MHSAQFRTFVATSSVGLVALVFATSPLLAATPSASKVSPKPVCELLDQAAVLAGVPDMPAGTESGGPLVTELENAIASKRQSESKRKTTERLLASFCHYEWSTGRSPKPTVDLFWNATHTTAAHAAQAFAAETKRDALQVKRDKAMNSFAKPATVVVKRVDGVADGAVFVSQFGPERLMVRSGRYQFSISVVVGSDVGENLAAAKKIANAIAAKLKTN